MARCFVKGRREMNRSNVRNLMTLGGMLVALVV